MSIDEIGKFKPASFDTVIMMGNNFGLFGGFKKARRLLRLMHTITTAEGQIIAEAVDPYQTNEKLHLAYQGRNRAQGRMSGQLRFRIRHKNVVGAWFDYLLVSQKEMKAFCLGQDGSWRRFYPTKGLATLRSSKANRIGPRLRR